ncbi:kinase-like domain-containing protein [Gigaspora rosea]|uniref:Kinase-like domain-containing protein n=1 Tax=Gigaspora rosea TaxID=44941 RepID=A0A397U9S3_9GLOM|nr:kinase-like domain-containing protein [Gigaspora rosea]
MLDYSLKDPLDYDIFVPIDEEYPYDFDINASDYLNDPDYMEENFFMSGNPKIDKFIRNDGRLKWIPYGQLTNIEYLARGGFGVVSKAKWKSQIVVLKSLNNSKDITADILREIAYHQQFDHHNYVIYIMQCYGISRDPTTGNYLMVMRYFEDGNLRQYLDSNYGQISLNDKLGLLYSMANGLYHIHFRGLIHKDFHPGNILNKYSKELGNISCFIADFGLCKPIDEANDGKNIYGVLPYVAPEVLKGKPYTQASDIYSLGIVAYELLSGLPPYYSISHDISLTIDICNGLRPNLDVVCVPQLLKTLIIKCWDDNPTLRPEAQEILFHFRKWYFDSDPEFRLQYQQIKVAKEELLTSNNLTYQTHPQAIYQSIA